LGRIGQSGETYAFGRYGKLLSESRFDEDLRKAGLIGEGQNSILLVSVRDPGGDMIEGFTPAVPRYQQPLTLMAQQATKGKAGLNVEELEQFSKLAIGREIKMIQLKQEINELRGQLGQGEKYEIVQ